MKKWNPIECSGFYAAKNQPRAMVEKIKLPYDPAVPFLGIHPNETIIQKGTCTPMFIAALFTVAKTWK